MSRQRNANHNANYYFGFQLTTLLSTKFPFMRERVATDDRIHKSKLLNPIGQRKSVVMDFVLFSRKLK